MADPTETPNPAEPALPPRMTMHTQFVRDLSFENPRGPAALNDPDDKPQVEVQVNVETKRTAEHADRYEVALKINATAKKKAGPAFLLELDYCGVFEITGFGDNVLAQVLLVECPRLLFPFARRIAADAVRDGGFPTLFLDPIDFLGLYRQRLSEEARKARPMAAPGAQAGNGGVKPS
jgi:preprotein translocase subunit SecB